MLTNVGLEATGHKKGEYQFLDSHNDLNMSPQIKEPLDPAKLSNLEKSKYGGSESCAR